jgi:hypothetical protein
LLDLPPAHEKMAARSTRPARILFSRFSWSKHRLFVQHRIRQEQHRNHFSRNSGNFSYLNFVHFRALTFGDICFEQNCKKVQDLVDELCDFEASK